MSVVTVVERERTRLRVAEAAGAITLGLALTAAIVGISAWLLADARWISLPRGAPLLVWCLLVLVNGALGWWTGRRLHRELTRPSVAAGIEREQKLRAGAVRGVIEVADTNAVGRHADRALATTLSQRGSSLVPRMHHSARRRALRLLATAGVTTALLLWGAPSLNDGLMAIRRPIAAWRGTLLPRLRFRELPRELLRGESLRIRVDAPGRRRVLLNARGTGEAWRAISLGVDGATGIATTTLGPVRGDLALVASDGRTATDSAYVRVGDRPFVGGVVLRAVYPAYLGRAAEGLPVGEPVRIPRGTVIGVAGRASTALRRVYVRGQHDSVAFRTTGHAFDGLLTPAESQRLDWYAFGTKGPITDVPLPLEIEVIPDSAPRVELVSPATDTIIATTDHVALQITATDDHGLATVDMNTQREAGGGKKEAIVTQRLVTAPGAVWNGTPLLDLATRELNPGDELHLQIVATDNSPWAQRGVSREVVLRIPTMEERRVLARSMADSTASEAHAAAAAQRTLEQRTEEASRERGARSRGNAGARGAEASTPPAPKEMSFESAEKARTMAQEQKALTERVNRLRETAKRLEEQLRQASALDSSLARQLREAQELLRDALTPALLEQMRKLENASRDLSGDQAREALKNLAEMQRRLREQLEKSAQMLKRAAIEGAMQTLRDEAKEISEKQRLLADSGKNTDADARRQQSRQLADRSERLATAVKRLEERLQWDRAQAGAKRTQSAQQHAASSTERMRQQDPRNAADQMERAAEDLQSARDQQVGEWKQELTSALDESIQELLQMAREESTLEEKARAAGREAAKNERLRGQQSAVQQGVDKTGERLQRQAQKSSLLSGRAQRAMSDAKQRVGQATQQLSEPRNGQQVGSALADAAEALNRAAAALARDRERANGATSATGFAEMLQQLQEMAKRQGSINAQAQGLLPIPGATMSSDAQATARMLARQQRAIAQQLEEMGDGGATDRASELAREARRLADVLEQTRVDASTVARQQQLFRRLLDAGRSLEKEDREDTEKREAKAATGDDRFDPGQAAANGRPGARFREPTWSELRGLTGDERRAILEYFKRINVAKP